LAFDYCLFLSALFFIAVLFYLLTA